MVELDRSDGQVVRIIEQIPLYGSLYSSIGQSWRGSGPRQIEQELVVVVDRLAKSPIPLEVLTSDLGIDGSDIDRLYRIGVDTSIIQTVESSDGVLLYSPYMAFENPAMLYQAFANHGSGQLAEALTRVSKYQGLPVAQSDPILTDAVGLGLISAPAVELPNGLMQPFAAMPFDFGSNLTRDRKPLLDKALAIIACARCGQHFGGTTNARDVGDILEALLTRDHLRPHESHERQYKMLRDLGVIDFLPDDQPWGRWVRPALIRTEENVEAVRLALTLIQGNEVLSGREPAEGVRTLLDLDARSIKPLRTTARTASRPAIPRADLNKAFEIIMGRGER